MSTNLSKPLKLFYSYARADVTLRASLDAYLSGLKQQNLISTWDDLDIIAGTDWQREINQQIENADIILLLVSPDFLASDFCYSTEMQIALQRHAEGTAYVIPIILRPCRWTDAPFSNLQALPTAARPVVSWRNIGDAFEDIALNIEKIVQERIVQERRTRAITFSVQRGDVTTFDADVLALKYAQAFYGTDDIVASLLKRRLGIPSEDLEPRVGKFQLIDTKKQFTTKQVLFVGVPPIDEFDYPQIRQFAADVLRILAIQAPYTEHLVMTIHGIGYGLDEVEAVQSQIAGYIDALRESKFPQSLASITIIDINEARVQRLCKAADEKLTRTNFAEPVGKSGQFRFIIKSPGRLPISASKLDTTGTAEYAKKHAFIAMPFAEEMHDVFYFGIQEPVRSMGLVCERIDETAFTGDILDRVKKKIETASVVIADLTGANPNVYLEVGYAWGKGKPTLLLVRNGQELRFDVQGQRCLKYSSIKNLNDTLKRELKILQEDKII